jgi:diguanylate cyclase (GGDEF)-like protein/PAS domain S-box-containing protein
MADGGWVATHDDVTEHRRREASFRLLFDNNPMPMWVFDRASLKFLAVNNAAVTHYGYSHRQFLAMSVLDIRPPEERSVFEQFLRALPAVQYNMDVGKHQRADGSKIDVSVYSQALRYEDHDARLAAIYDVTERKLTEDDLRRTRKFLDTIVENVPVPILVKDVPHAAKDARGCQYSLINRAAEAFFDISRGQIIGKTVEEVYPQDDAAAIIAENNETLRSGKPVETADHRVRRLGREQGTRIITSKSVTIRDDDGHARHLVTVIDDVTERRHAEERILQMAHRDNLTELPNRTAFSEFFAATLERAASGGEQFAVLSMDLDRFKEANDVYGHAIGDALLREVARRLRSAADGAFLARIGGDEFILFVIDGPQPAAATALAERLLAAFADDFEVEGQRLRIGLSIGGAVYPTDGTDAKTLMVNADAALYRAKAETRGSVLFFEPEMSARLRERHALQEDLRAAVARDELLLHYQPQVRMDGEIIGFEALVRWQCPKRGLVAPAVFIPVAEESTLIIPVGEWVLREACREAASWPLPLTIAVNISPIQFRHGDLPALVHSILLETGLAPGRLELEITEGIFINDFSHAVSILRRLKSLGVQIALDDFGTGYSSLSYLHSFSFDKIKIDRAFVGDLEYNRHSIAIVRAVINLGHSLNIPILAEGVETNAQRAFLLKDGCDQMQGYLTGRPLPIGAYADRICGASDAPLKIGLAH